MFDVGQVAYAYAGAPESPDLLTVDMPAAEAPTAMREQALWSGWSLAR